MKLLITAIVFLSMGNFLAEAADAPVPKAILLHSTNQPARINVVLLTAEKWRNVSAKEQLIVTNPKILSLSAGSATARKEGSRVSLIFHDVKAYGPFVEKGDYGNDQKLKMMKLADYTFSLRENDVVQINDELLTPESIWQRFRAKTETRKSD